MVNNSNRRDHLANERTFLAWMRTNLGIIALGFVMERFSFFFQRLSPSSLSPPTSATSPSLLGLSLIALGTLLCLLAFLSYRKREKEIREGAPQSSSFLAILLTLLLFLGGLSLILYLL